MTKFETRRLVLASLLSQASASAIAVNSANPAATSGSSIKQLRLPANVADFGAVGDGASDDTEAFIRAISAGRGASVWVPSPRTHYKITNTLVVPPKTFIVGESKGGTKIRYFGRDQMIELGADAGLFNLFLEGDGQEAIGVNISGKNGQQIIEYCRITDFNGPCLNFSETMSGSGFSALGCTLYQRNGLPGSGKFAIIIADDANARACPRKFVHLETGGFASFSFGGSNSTYVSNSFLSDLAFSKNTRATFITGCRIATVTPLIVRGGQNIIANCDIYPRVTIDVGAGGIVIGPNAYNNPPVVDSSGNSQNLVYCFDDTYEPVVSAANGGAEKGNGVVKGRWSRNGGVVTVNIQFTLGTNTNLGRGGLRFALPDSAPSYSGTEICGNVRAVHAGIIYTGVCVKPTRQQFIELQRDSSGAIAAESPVKWSSGDVFQITFAYIV